MDTSRLARGYQRFAELEARGHSPIYEAWALGVSQDSTVLGLIAALPREKVQPNLVFAAARYHGAPTSSYEALRPWLIEHWESVAQTAMDRSTQTNEVSRCALTLPTLSRCEEPIALIEVGAAAGLCLFPDRYNYNYTGADVRTRLEPLEGPSTVDIDCSFAGAAAPETMPRIAWRAGIDLNPLDVRDPKHMEWLTTLVWPEQAARRRRLERAAAVVASDPPQLFQGDLVDKLPDVLALAPPGMRIVVYNTSVLVYVDERRRRAFVELLRAHPEVTWVSNEGADVLPELTAQLRVPAPGKTILAVNGEVVALTGPHGQSYEAI